MGSVCQEIGSGKGEDKYGRNTFDDSKDCRGKTAVRMGKESRAEAVEWRSILFCRRKNVVCDSDYDRQSKEEMMREMITRNLPSKMYEDCFYIRRERIWRLNGEKVCHVETMFPGYLFVTTEDPEAIYWKLREIPGLTKLLRTEESQFLSVSPEEQDFLEDLIDKDEEKIVRLSEVTLDEEKKILSAKGPLRKYVKQIVKKKIRLCYVMIEKELFGQKRKILIGIRTGKMKQKQDKV